MDWICGYDTLLSNCYQIEILTDMLLFADYYDIQRPVVSVTNQIEAVSIDLDNLISAMECVTKIEKVESCKDVASNLENDCVYYFEETLRSAKAVGLFVKNNIANINLVNRLLIKSTDLNTGESTCKGVDTQTSCSKCNVKNFSKPLSKDSY